jgi:hypothetical protein
MDNRVAAPGAEGAATGAGHDMSGMAAMPTTHSQ